MRIRTIKKMTLLSTLFGAGIVIATGYSIAANGNSSGGSASNSASGAGQSGAGGRGDIAVSLRKLNGVVRANDITLKKVNDNSAQGYVRTYRDAVNDLGTLQDQLETLNVELTALKATRTDADIQADIDKLELADFETQELYSAAVREYQDEMLTAATDSELKRLILAKEREIAAKTTEIATLEGDREDAWENLTGGRELTEEAMALLKVKLVPE